MMIALGILSVTAFAAPVPKAIKMQYDGIEKSMRKLNVDDFATYMSEDFVAIDPKGHKQLKSDFIKGVREIFADAKSANPMAELKGSKMHAGMVNVMFDFHLTVMMKNGGKITVHEIGTDTWRKVGGKWLCCKTVDKSLKVKMPPSMNGK